MNRQTYAAHAEILGSGAREMTLDEAEALLARHGFDKVRRSGGSHRHYFDDAGARVTLASTNRKLGWRDVAQLAADIRRAKALGPRGRSR